MKIFESFENWNFQKKSGKNENNFNFTLSQKTYILQNEKNRSKSKVKKIAKKNKNKFGKRHLFTRTKMRPGPVSSVT